MQSKTQANTEFVASNFTFSKESAISPYTSYGHQGPPSPSLSPFFLMSCSYFCIFPDFCFLVNKFVIFLLDASEWQQQALSSLGFACYLHLFRCLNFLSVSFSLRNSYHLLWSELLYFITLTDSLFIFGSHKIASF